MALNPNFVDVAYVIEKVYRDYGFDGEIFSDEVYEWTWEVMNLIGVPNAYIDRVTDGNGSNPDVVEIEDYRGTLPSDLHSVSLVREYSTKMPMICTGSPYREDGTDTNVAESQYSYKLSQGYIFPSFETGYVEIAYKAFPTSPLGLPLIPDDTKYVRAVEDYIADKIGFKLMLTDRLSQNKYDRIAQKKSFSIASARSKALIPTVDEMEAIKNRFLRLRVNPNFHNASFRYSYDKERLILHNNAGTGS